MPSLSPQSRARTRRAARLLVAMGVLAALVALPRVRAATPPGASAPAAAAPAAPAASATAAAKPGAKTAKGPTCQAIMQRLSGSLAGTPSQADKPGTVLVDVDKAGVTMACSHSDAVSIPVPGSTKTR